VCHGNVLIKNVQEKLQCQIVI